MRLLDFIKQHPTIAYEPDLKEKFKKYGKRFCNEILMVLSPTVRNHTYSFNPGGIAVSGDHALMIEFHSGDFVHMFFNIDGVGGINGICYRRCYSLTDYTGDRNHWVNYSDLKAPYSMADKLRSFITTSEQLEARA